MGTYSVMACTEFSAAHRIEGHPRCGRIHGHNYRVCVEIAEDEPMGIDLDYLQEWLRANVYEAFDHQYLNEVFGSSRVTSEDIARDIADRLPEKLRERLIALIVCETRDLCVVYRP